MKDQNIAKVYAQTFIALGKADSVDMAKDMIALTEVINSSNDLENVLFLDVFTTEEKESVFATIANKIGLSKITISAFQYLIREKRISLLPLIAKEVIIADDHAKGFLRGTIEGAGESIDEAHKQKLIDAITKHVGDVKPQLDYRQSDEITAGYKITLGDLQLDATIDNQLKSFKESVLGN